MKQKSLFLLTATALCAPALSFAANLQPSNLIENSNFALQFGNVVMNPQADMPASCNDIKLDDTQKMQIKDACFDFKKQQNTLGAEVKNAMMDSIKTFSSATSTRDEGVDAQAMVKEKMDALVMAHNDLGLKVFYDILKPEQRAPAMQCLMDWMKQKKKK
ncbi:MAG: Spy/CpxP family protein refolding chaperone [Bacillota bacterium]